MNLPEAKAWLRSYALQARLGLPPLQREKNSGLIAKALLRTKIFRQARVIAAYMPFRAEVDTEILIREAWKKGKTILLPITRYGLHRPHFAHFHHRKILQKGRFGSLELVDPSQNVGFRKIDMVLVPGLVFDERGHRLGYGGGFYDRVLQKTPKAAHVGLFFSSQRVHRVPNHVHDNPLCFIVTEKGLTMP